AEPGKHNFASAGGGSTFHMAAELFKAQAGVPLVHIPYRGGGPALVDTIAGQVSLSFPVLSAAQPQVQAGKLRALGVTGSKRSPLMPDVPTIAEAGLPGYNFETWFMVFAPAATPQAIVDKLNVALKEALATPAIKDRMTREGFDPTPSSVEQARTKLEKDLPQWGKLIKDRGIKAD
ncbi:MAG: tripartite tricarboxylate transporter substrate binding protein, partial [Caulobacteraceae bacterium]